MPVRVTFQVMLPVPVPLPCFWCRCRSILDCWCRCRRQFRCRFSTPAKYIPLLMFIIACRSSVFCCPVKIEVVRKNTFDFFSFPRQRKDLKRTCSVYSRPLFFLEHSLVFLFFRVNILFLRAQVFVFSRSLEEKGHCKQLNLTVT